MARPLGIPVKSIDLIAACSGEPEPRLGPLLSCLRRPLSICAFRALFTFCFVDATLLKQGNGRLCKAPSKQNRPMLAPYLRHLRLQLSM